MTQLVRICRDCGEEYRPDAVRCSDCGGELEDRQLDDDGNPIDGDEPEAPPAPTVERRIVFVAPRASEVVPLAEALREAGIEYHLAEQPPADEGAGAHYALLVAEEDAARALSALAPLIAPERADEELSAVESRFEPGRGYLTCPACGAAQSPGATDCADCGLTLGVAEEGAPACARCNAPLPEPGAACPACGNSPIG